MAKLSARGRKEVARFSRVSRRGDDVENGVLKRVLYRALMTDRKILERLVVTFAPGPYDHGKPQRHDYGWKVYGKLKEGVANEDWIKEKQDKGWVMEMIRVEGR